MIVTRLKLANLRVIEAAELHFQPGMNLIVGVNGVGKTSVLEALGVCLSAVVKRANKLPSGVQSFSVDDIRAGADALTVECDFRIGDRAHRHVEHTPRESSAAQKKAGISREQAHDTPGRKLFLNLTEAVSVTDAGEITHDTPEKTECVDGSPLPATGSESDGRPLAVLFSTNRAVPSGRAPAKAVAAGGIVGAFADAFARRELRLGEFAAWMKVQEALRCERPTGSRVLDAFEDAVRRFLPGYCNLRQEGDERPHLWINRNSTPVPVRQLSDGERGSLALVLDLTRRLAQANPEMDLPASQAEAVVLIDEIDLHLHPKWQRQIVHNLTRTFPRCQFIATTHSPQIIGEVPPERIQIIEDGQVYSPTHSFGVDSSRILEEIMDADSRAKEVRKLLDEISRVIGERQFHCCHELLGKLAEQIGEVDPEVTRLRTLLGFLEGRE